MLSPDSTHVPAAHYDKLSTLEYLKATNSRLGISISNGNIIEKEEN